MQHEDVVTLLGRYSNGKTTLVHMIMGMRRRDSRQRAFSGRRHSRIRSK